MELGYPPFVGHSVRPSTPLMDTLKPPSVQATLDLMVETEVSREKTDPYLCSLSMSLSVY